jgi:hypothetical protein
MTAISFGNSSTKKGTSKIERQSRTTPNKQTLFEEMSMATSFPAPGSGRWSTTGRERLVGAHQIWPKRTHALLQHNAMKAKQPITGEILLLVCTGKLPTPVLH